MKMWRYRLARWFVHAGLNVLPPGRVQIELEDLLRGWGAMVYRTLNKIQEPEPVSRVEHMRTCAINLFPGTTRCDMGCKSRPLFVGQAPKTNWWDSV